MQNIVKGRVYWVTGLSGAGKTTIGGLLWERLRQTNNSVLLLDGDKLRQVFGGDLGYSREERYECAMRYARLCHMLAEEGVSVVCCTISMFEDVRIWNREHIEDYWEIYLKVPMEVLLQRNQKGLYESERHRLVGFGVDMEEPVRPDVVVINDGSITPLEQVDKIMAVLKEKV